tara:strand:+ start:13602 stop:13706 length:105 start_codon:yes stop_codon:yes gene_type:complete
MEIINEIMHQVLYLSIKGHLILAEIVLQENGLLF